MKYWFCSDPHFDHSNIIKYTNRPFKDVNHMNEQLIKNFNSVIGPNDVVYCLGDFAFKNPEKFVCRLNGQWNLVKGNHDPKDLKNAGFASVRDVASITIEGQYIFMSHYAHRVWNKAHYGAMHLYGHSHNGLKGEGRSMDVGVDTNNYMPYSFEEIYNRLSKEPYTKHH